MSTRKCILGKYNAMDIKLNLYKLHNNPESLLRYDDFKPHMKAWEVLSMYENDEGWIYDWLDAMSDDDNWGNSLDPDIINSMKITSKLRELFEYCIKEVDMFSNDKYATMAAQYAMEVTGERFDPKGEEWQIGSVADNADEYTEFFGIDWKKEHPAFFDDDD